MQKKTAYLLFTLLFFTGVVFTAALEVPSSVVFTAATENSATLTWSAGANPVGTQYRAKIGSVPALPVFTVTDVGTTLALFTGLNPNTTYYAQVQAVSPDTGFSPNVSTITLAAQPSGGFYSAVTSASLSLGWLANNNPEDTRYEVIASSEVNYSPVFYSSAVYINSFNYAGFLSNTTYYLEVAAVNYAGTKSSFYNFVPVLTYAAAPVSDSVSLDNILGSSVRARWADNGNPVETLYNVQASTAADFSGYDYGLSGWYAGVLRVINGLDGNIRYYFRVRAKDRQNRITDWLNLGSALTPSGPDTNPPTIVNLQSGDTVWRGSVSGLYSVYFQDYGSGLDKFAVELSTYTAASNVLAAGSTVIVSGINAQTYNTSWSIPASLIATITENVTSYVSVRIYDKADNSSVLRDAFFILRDTTPPNITNNSVSPAGWIASDPGAVFDVDFADALSGLTGVYYSASEQEKTANAGVLGWTAVTGFTTGKSFTANWGVDFAALSDGATNFISVRAVDAAGNISETSDVFRINKNTGGPATAIFNPSSAYISTAAAFSGSASALTGAASVAYSEISLQLAAGNYFDGAGFNSSAEIWLRAAGLSTWSYNVSTISFIAGQQYKLKARSEDTLGFKTKTPAEILFRLDQIKPGIFISTPLAGSNVYNFDAVSGAAADTGGAGLGSISVFVKRTRDGKWWNFNSNSWDAVQVGSSTVAGAGWFFTPGSLLRGNLENSQEYFVTALAADAAVPPNEYGFGIVGASFTWVDTTAPAKPLAFSASTGTLPGRIDLSWITPGDDGPGIPLTSGQFAVQYSTDTAAVFSTQAAQVLISTGLVESGSVRYYTIDGLTPEVTYYLTLWISDEAGLWSLPSDLAGSISGYRLANQISGTVKTPGGEGVTGVIIEAYNTEGLQAASTYTLDDGLGSFILTGLPDGFYRIQAIWSANNFSSAIAKDLIPMGYADANFSLSLNYQLASISGSLPSFTPHGAKPLAVGASVELWAGGKKIARAVPDGSGRFIIRNLLPGKYSLKAVLPGGESKTVVVELAAGQALEVKPFGVLLKKSSVYVYPNPALSYAIFHAETDIVPVRVQLSIYTMDGLLVKEAKGEPVSGTYSYRWDFSGSKPASGAYLYMFRFINGLTGETQTVTKKLAVIR